jgi:hypothetical protein
MASIADIGRHIMNKIPGIERRAPSQLKEHLTDAYSKVGYIDKYGGSVIISSLILMAFGCIFGYNYFLSSLKFLKKDWKGIRCNPLFIPFAGLINAPANMSKIEYTAENLNYCLTDILKDVVEVETAAESAARKGAANAVSAIGNDMNSARTLFSNIRKSAGGIFSGIFSKIFNVLVPLRIILKKSKTALNRSQGILSTTMYTGLGSVLSSRSFFGAIPSIFIALIVFFVGVSTATALGAWWIWPLWAVFAVEVAVITAIIAVTNPVIQVSRKIIEKTNRINKMGSQFHKESFSNINSTQYKSNIENNSFCFDGETPIRMKNGEIKKIKDVILGDILEDGGEVTATFKSSSKNQTMFTLSNIIVTGEHTLLDNKMGTIKVKNHPDSINYGKYYEQFVYCINTTTKKIHINNIKFLDWDEVDDMDIIMLRKKMEDHLPKKFDLKHIHEFLECGFHANTLIELDDGRSIPIKDIQVNDQLRFGEQVLGIVEISGKNIDNVKEYEINGFKIIGSPNLRVHSKDLGGCVSTFDLGGIPVEKPQKLYNIITNSKFFRINGTIFFDYNGGLESILWRKDNVDYLDNN